MTDRRIAEIEARAEAAPKGPWVIEGDYPQSVTNAEALVIAECFEGPQYPPSIAEFIAHAREDVPALIAEVKRLRALLDGPDGDGEAQEAAERRCSIHGKPIPGICDAAREGSDG